MIEAANPQSRELACRCRGGCAMGRFPSDRIHDFRCAGAYGQIKIVHWARAKAETRQRAVQPFPVDGFGRKGQYTPMRGAAIADEWIRASRELVLPGRLGACRLDSVECG